MAMSENVGSVRNTRKQRPRAQENRHLSEFGDKVHNIFNTQTLCN